MGRTEGKGDCPPLRWAGVLTAGHAGTPARLHCVNFVVSDGKASETDAPGKAGREERICALVHGLNSRESLASGEA